MSVRFRCDRCTITISFVVYYESIKRESKIRGIYECRCDERLQTKTKEFTRLPYTGLVLELEHLKIETRLISERFANAMGERENKFVYYESIKREPKDKRYIFILEVPETGSLFH